ncbi:MAG: TIGR02449 family protein [Gammaproteobacteria bacterium]
MKQDIDQSQELRLLEEKLDALIRLCGFLQKENSSLKIKQEELVREKAGLIEKTALARSKVEAMITRLKSMEHGA